MLWIAVASTVALVILTLFVTLTKRSSHDLGSVSGRWIAEHRVDTVWK